MSGLCELQTKAKVYRVSNLENSLYLWAVVSLSSILCVFFRVEVKETLDTFSLVTGIYISSEYRNHFFSIEYLTVRYH